AIVRPEIDEADENLGKIGLGLDVVQFAGLYQRRDDGPIFSTIIVTGEESFKIEGGAADNLEHVGSGGLLLQGFAQLLGARSDFVDEDLFVGNAAIEALGR